MVKGLNKPIFMLGMRWCDGGTRHNGAAFDKLDKLNEGMARMEALIEERNKREESLQVIIKEHESSIKKLEEQRAAAWGVKSVLAYIITTLIAMWGAVK